jgi:hypothetical protein
MSNVKNLLSSIAAFAVIIGTAVNEYMNTLSGGEINYLNLLLAVAVAVIGYLTGKGANAKKKVL